MHPRSLPCLVAWLTIVTASGSHHGKRQDGPVDPSTAKDCTYFDTALDKTFTCKYFEETWNLSAADFLDWNPSVKADCSGIKVGNSYCIEVNNGLPRPTTSSKTTTTARPTTTTTIKTTSTTSRPAGPSPTQAGLIASCKTFYKAVSGDSCWDIVNVKYAGAFSLENFYAWNPAVGTDCHGLLADYHYCVGVGGVTTTKKTTTTAKITTTTKKTSAVTSCTNKGAPTPTQPGTLCTCKKWHAVKSGDTCDKLEKQYGVKEADFLKWNPQVGGKACGSLWAGYNVCVGV